MHKLCNLCPLLATFALFFAKRSFCYLNFFYLNLIYLNPLREYKYPLYPFVLLSELCSDEPCSDVQMFRRSDVQMFRRSDVQMFRCSDVQVHRLCKPSYRVWGGITMKLFGPQEDNPHEPFHVKHDVINQNHENILLVYQ